MNKTEYLIQYSLARASAIGIVSNTEYSFIGEALVNEAATAWNRIKAYEESRIRDEIREEQREEELRQKERDEFRKQYNEGVKNDGK